MVLNSELAIHLGWEFQVFAGNLIKVVIIADVTNRNIFPYFHKIWKCRSICRHTVPNTHSSRTSLLDIKDPHLKTGCGGTMHTNQSCGLLIALRWKFRLLLASKNLNRTP